jgi:hypothetical protein
MSIESHGGIILTEEKRKNLEETCPSATLSTNPMWTDPGANPGLRDERLVTNRLSHGMANKTVTLYDFLEETIVSRLMVDFTWSFGCDTV